MEEVELLVAGENNSNSSDTFYQESFIELAHRHVHFEHGWELK